MKTIEEPEGQDWSHTWRCSGCRAKLEADASDIRWQTPDRPWESASTCLVCPHCGTTKYVTIPRMLETQLLRAEHADRPDR